MDAKTSLTKTVMFYHLQEPRKHDERLITRAELRARHANDFESHELDETRLITPDELPERDQLWESHSSSSENHEQMSTSDGLYPTIIQCAVVAAVFKILLFTA